MTDSLDWASWSTLALRRAAMVSSALTSAAGRAGSGRLAGWEPGGSGARAPGDPHPRERSRTPPVGVRRPADAPWSESCLPQG